MTYGVTTERRKGWKWKSWEGNELAYYGDALHLKKEVFLAQFEIQKSSINWKQRWEFIKERFQEKKYSLSTKKTNKTQEKRKKTRFDQEKETKISTTVSSKKKSKV